MSINIVNGNSYTITFRKPRPVGNPLSPLPPIMLMTITDNNAQTTEELVFFGADAVTLKNVIKIEIERILLNLAPP